MGFALEGDEPHTVPHPPGGERPQSTQKSSLASARESAAAMRAEMVVRDFGDMRPDLVKEIAVRSGPYP